MSKVADPSDDVQEMRTACAKGRALMGGTTAMREAGVTYLPKFGAESDTAYKARLNSSWLFNGYRKTVKDMSGRVFGKPVELADAPNDLVTWCENVDLQGRDLSTFAREVFEDGLSGAGISYVMVDAPARDAVVSKADAQAQNLRPFLVHLSVDEVLGWRSETVNNVTRITQFRIMECVTEPDPEDEFADKEIEQVRVLDLIESRVQVRLFRKAKQANGVEDWVLWGEPTFVDMPEITVAAFYANRDGFFEGEPPLDDLADVNIAHWQSQSDQRHILHYARVPILFGSGVEENDITIGGSNIVTAGADAKLAYVEHSGSAIESGRQDLKDLEFQMEALGLQLLTPRQSAQSATGEALDAAKETSQLAMMADALRDCLEQCMIWMCQYGGLGDQSPTVQINDDFGVQPFGPQEASVLLQMVTAGELSRQTFIEELVRRGFIRSDLTAEEEYQRILADQAGGVQEFAANAANAGGMPTTVGGMPAA